MLRRSKPYHRRVVSTIFTYKKNPLKCFVDWNLQLDVNSHLAIFCAVSNSNDESA